MDLIINEFCKSSFLSPFNLSERDVINTFWLRDHYQRIILGEIHFYLYIKRFRYFFVLIKGYWIDGIFRISEAYRIYQDIATEKNLRVVNLLKILEKFYHLNGAEVNFAGIKSKFILNHCGVGIPKIPADMNAYSAQISHILKEFVKSTVQSWDPSSTISCTPLLRIVKGHYIDFLDIYLYYEMNPKRYHQYLKKFEF